MLKVTWNMNSGKTYVSTMDMEDWNEVAQFLCDNPDFINIDNGGQQVCLATPNISDFTMEYVR